MGREGRGMGFCCLGSSFRANFWIPLLPCSPAGVVLGRRVLDARCLKVPAFFVVHPDKASMGASSAKAK